MSFSQTPQKINFNKFLALENENERRSKFNEKLIKTPVSEILSDKKIIYDSGFFLAEWLDENKENRKNPLEFEDVDDAFTLVEETILPKKAYFNLTSLVDVNEDLLPFIKMKVMTKSNESTDVRSVFKFTSNRLKPIRFAYYRWQGNTSASWISHITGNLGQTTSSFTPPPQPEPASAYDEISGVSTLHMHTGGLSLYVNFDLLTGKDNQGLTVGDWYSIIGQNENWYVLQTAYGVIRNFNPDDNFTPQWELYFPIGTENEISLPRGTSEDQEEHSDDNYPRQYWLYYETYSFEDLVYNIFDGDFDLAKAEVLKWFPDAIFAEEDNTTSPRTPYGAFEIVERERLASSHQNLYFIEQEEGYLAKMEGSIISVAPATEVSQLSGSSIQIPIYKPKVEDILIRVILEYTPNITSDTVVVNDGR